MMEEGRITGRGLGSCASLYPEGTAQQSDTAVSVWFGGELRTSAVCQKPERVQTVIEQD